MGDSGESKNFVTNGLFWGSWKVEKMNHIIREIIPNMGWMMLRGRYNSGG